MRTDEKRNMLKHLTEQCYTQQAVCASEYFSSVYNHIYIRSYEMKLTNNYRPKLAFIQLTLT